MKAVRMWTFISVTVIALTAGRGFLWAQPAGDVVTVEGDDKPWNQGVPLDKRLAAVAMFKEGNRRFYIPLFAQAAEQYAAALRLWRHPAFYFNLALAELNLGQDVGARESLSHVMEHGAQALDPKDFQEAQKQLLDLERKLGRIRIICQTEGAEVTLDGVALFIGPGRFQSWVTAKAHEITAKKQGYLSEARRLAVASGQLQDLDLKLITLSEAADTGRRWATWKPWGVVAAGVAVAAAGGIIHVLSSKNFAGYDADFLTLPCTKTHGCTNADIGPTRSARLTLAIREQQVAIGGYILGGTITTLGAVLLYMNRPRLPEQADSKLQLTGVAIVPAVTSDEIGFLASVSY